MGAPRRGGRISLNVMIATHEQTRPRRVVRVLRSITCVLIVAALTAVLFRVLHVNALIAGFAYVLAVLIVAARWGLAESLTTSIAAVFCLNYFFLPPIFSITIADPQNWVALFSILATAITASQLSANVRNQAAEAQGRRAEVERLYQLSLSFMLVDTTRELGPQIVAKLREEFGFESVAFFDSATGAMHVSGPGEEKFDGAALRNAAQGGASWQVSREKVDEPGKEIVVVPVGIGGRMLGSLGTMGAPVSEPALQAITNLAAVALEHAHQQIAFGRLEVARQNERLRSVLLDALAHDFLTPLTAVKTAITTVRSEYSHESDEEEFLAVVEEEADKLGEMINEITDLARIEPGKPRIRRQKVPIHDLVHASLERMRNLLKSHGLVVNVDRKLPVISADAEMLGLALRQLLGNAAKFSPPETDIEISARAEDGSVVIAVRDFGPGVPQEETALIFERFYRGKGARESVAGTGMGLSIARDIVQAHHGRIWAENAVGGGARFSMKVPIYFEGRSQ